MAESTGIEPVRPEGLDALAPRCLAARPTPQLQLSRHAGSPGRCCPGSWRFCRPPRSCFATGPNCAREPTFGLPGRTRTCMPSRSYRAGHPVELREDEYDWLPPHDSNVPVSVNSGAPSPRWLDGNEMVE